ncbi:MAG: hypothetical protein GWO02_18480, partial [Gammaproteobacteria bacterium]|nr:hypothetical protein [Gammaproteobacteria bacterium]
VSIDVETEDVNLLDAAARGASQGVTLALNIAGMLIAFLALLALVNGILGIAGQAFAATDGMLRLSGAIVAVLV